MAEKPVEFLMTQVDPEGDRVNVVQLLTDLQTFDVLAKGFLPEQMCTHLPTVQGNHTFALHSYTQNVSLEVAFHGQRRDPKVTLLNAMHEQLKAQLGLALYRKSAGCDSRAAVEIITVIRASLFPFMPQLPPFRDKI